MLGVKVYGYMSLYNERSRLDYVCVCIRELGVGGGLKVILSDVYWVLHPNDSQALCWILHTAYFTFSFNDHSYLMKI